MTTRADPATHGGAHDQQEATSPGDPFAGPGELRALGRALDWGTTPLGPVARWPEPLRTTVRLMLASPLPTSLWCGPELTLVHNDAFGRLLGERRSAALGRPAAEVWRERWPAVAASFAAVRAAGSAACVDAPLADGEPPLTHALSPLVDDAGRCLAVHAVSVATGARAPADPAHGDAGRQEGEARYRALAELSPDAVWVNLDGRFVYANPAAARLMGADDPAALLGLSPYDVAHPEDRDRMRARVARLLAGGGPEPVAELRFRRLDGTVIEVETAAAMVPWEGRPAVQVITRDVSTRRRAEAERLRLAAEAAAERERLEALIRHMPAPVALLVGPEHRHALVNDAFRRISGGGRDVTGLTVREAFPDLEGQGIYERLDHVYATGESFVAQESLVRYDRDGTGVRDTWFDVRFEPLRDAAGQVVGILNFAVDVTVQVLARREIEAHLAASENARHEAGTARAQSDAVLASIADAFYLLDREWRFTYVNDAAEPLLQTTRDRLLGRTLWEAFPDVAGSPFEGPYREAMDTGHPTSAEAYFPPLGTWFDVHTYAWTGGLMVHFRDIGARKAAEAERERLLHALEVERARLEEVFQRSPNFIVAFSGPDQVYRFVNDAYYQLVGHREVVGKPLLEAIPEIRGQGFEELLERVRQTGEPWVGHETPVQLQRTPGAPLETRYLDMVFQPLVEAEGSRSGVVVHGSDVTSHVLARREVERLLGESERARADAEAARREAELARAEAEAANRGKSEFLAVMSHELRTPLNAIGGYAELMEMGVHGPVSDPQRAALERIQRSQRALLSVINEVLNYARLETGAVTYRPADVPVAGAVGAAEALVAPQLRAKGLRFGCVVGDAGLAVRADPDKLQQILLNLLSNAIKFTDSRDGWPGAIEVRCEAAAEGRAAIHVRDTGVGIPADKLDAVFEPFVQVDQRLTREHSGTGLGLAISRDLARGMGGDLTVESTLGVGSTFTLTLPLAGGR